MPGTHEPLTDPLVVPGLHARDPWSVYARLRAEAPVAWNDTVGFWALSRYAEVHEVSCDPERFSSRGGILTMEIGIEYPSPPTMMPSSARRPSDCSARVLRLVWISTSTPRRFNHRAIWSRIPVKPSVCGRPNSATVLKRAVMRRITP